MPLHPLAHPLCVTDHVVSLVGLDGAQRGGAGERMAVIGEPAIEDAVLEVLRDLRAYSNRAERDVTARQTLCHRDDVGHDIPMVDGKPLTGPAKSGHDLVANHQDAVPVAQIPHTL